MKSEFGREASEESVRLYRSFMHPPTRWPWVFAACVVAALMAYAMTLAHDAWNAYLCHGSEGTWVKGACTPPVIEVKHYSITMQPGEIPNPNDVPAPPPPPTNDGQTL